MAFDILSIPAMSAEIERAFSQAKHLLTDCRNCLSAATVNSCECLKQWQHIRIVAPPAGLGEVQGLEKVAVPEVEVAEVTERAGEVIRIEDNDDIYGIS